MRRLLLVRLLSLIVLGVTAGIVEGEDQHQWVGRQVMPKSARHQPRVNGRVAMRPIICVRTVKQVKGDWLSVGDGWLRQSEVVPVEEAVEWFTAQIEHRPAAFDYVSRAAARCVLGDCEGAVADCTAALEINPRLDVAYYHRAAARAEEGNFSEAIRDYDAALRLNPRLVGAYLDRGAARLKVGDYAGSLKDVNNALRLSPRQTDAYYVRGIARVHLHKYQSALADLNYVLRANPSRAAAYDARGTCKEQLGQLDGALKDYDKAIELDPTNAIAGSHRDRLRVARATKSDAVPGAR
jgi:tetratricopeptide (TPR) repeat protein